MSSLLAAAAGWTYNYVNCRRADPNTPADVFFFFLYFFFFFFFFVVFFVVFVVFFVCFFFFFFFVLFFCFFVFFFFFFFVAFVFVVFFGGGLCPSSSRSLPSSSPSPPGWARLRACGLGGDSRTRPRSLPSGLG